MDFNKLIIDNAIADKRKQDRMNSDAQNLKEKMTAFINSLDVNMLIAIGAYGKDTYDFYGNKCRLFENTDSWNKMKIITSRTTSLNSKPSLVVVLNGQHGLCISGSYIETVMVGICNDEYVSSRTDESVWTENGLCPDLSKLTIERANVWKLAGYRMVGDSRTWFERCEDAMPMFEKELADYLTNRANGTK